jgi:hypothetical protein
LDDVIAGSFGFKGETEFRFLTGIEPEKGTAALEKLAPLLTTASVFVVRTAAKILMSVCHRLFAK